MKRVEDLRIRANSEREKLKELSKKEMTDLIKIEYEQAKKLYSELIYELNYSKMQVNLSMPDAYILDHAYPPYPQKLIEIPNSANTRREL